MSQKIKLLKEKLKTLYFDEGWSLKKVGNHFNCSARTVKREIERHGFETRNVNASYNINKEKLYELYYVKENPLSEVANHFDVSVSVITDRMDEEGWERRKGVPQNMSGENNPFYGKTHDEETRKQISEKNSERTWEEMFDEETLKKQREHIKNLKYWEGKNRKDFSKKYSGENHWHKGRNISQEWGEKISDGVEKSYEKIDGLREQRIEQISEFGGPAYNPEACKLIEEYGKKHGYDFQHAENGGEVYIDGYFVDGYDEEQNVVIEYYEKWHKRQREEDRKRKKEIIEATNCSFIEVYNKQFIKINWR